jgi:hypothetical protein
LGFTATKREKEIMNHPASPQLVTWLLIIVSILLVAGITYVYTNRNVRITSLLTVITILTIALFKLVGIVEIELNQYFLGKFNPQNLPYIVAQPGWHLLFRAWHIWILPVVVVIFIFAGIVFAILSYRKADAPKVEVLPIASATSIAGYTLTKAERLSTFMAMDAAKKEVHDVHEKLSEALLANAAYEIKISDLTHRVHELENELDNIKRNLNEEIETLTLELSAKNKENEYISSQLIERNRDLLRAQEMFEKLATLHRKMQEDKED